MTTRSDHELELNALAGDAGDSQSRGWPHFGEDHEGGGLRRSEPIVSPPVRHGQEVWDTMPDYIKVLSGAQIRMTLDN